jgi:Holliday junction resolvasome RuvABC DNA-binding subunit
MEKKLKEEAEKKKVEQLKAMGFPEEWAKDALKETKVANRADTSLESLVPCRCSLAYVRVARRAILTRRWSI